MTPLPMAPVVSTGEVDRLIAADAPVAIGVSGGKDSTAVTFATIAHLDAVGHRGPRVLVHADLGDVEWADSLPACRRLAEAVGLELVIVRRPKGGMMERWEQRWADNVRRWETLSCVKLRSSDRLMALLRPAPRRPPHAHHTRLRERLRRVRLPDAAASSGRRGG